MTDSAESSMDVLDTCFTDKILPVGINWVRDGGVKGVLLSPLLLATCLASLLGSPGCLACLHGCLAIWLICCLASWLAWRYLLVTKKANLRYYVYTQVADLEFETADLPFKRHSSKHNDIFGDFDDCLIVKLGDILCSYEQGWSKKAALEAAGEKGED